MAKVSLVRFEKVPAAREDLDQLIRWQVRKAAPFRIEEAQVAWTPGRAPAAAGREFVVDWRGATSSRSTRPRAAAGAHAGLVDLATFNLVNAVLARARRRPTAGDWLLVHVTPPTAPGIVRGGHLIFFRQPLRGTDEDAGRPGAPDGDVLRGPARSGRRVLAGAPGRRDGAAGSGPVLAATLEERLGGPSSRSTRGAWRGSPIASTSRPSCSMRSARRSACVLREP
jgi:hypothetical protein